MKHFLKHSREELEHVVWPTNKETKTYMNYTVGVIVVMSFLLALVGYAFQSGLQSVRGLFPHTPPVETTASGEAGVTRQEADDLIKALQARKEKKANSGAVSTGTTEAPIQ